VLWTVAVVVSWVAPRLMGELEFDVQPGHFVERHGLVVLIAIGESIIAVGIGAADLAVDAELVIVAVLGVLLSAALWWTYFGGDDVRAEEALAAMPPARRGYASLEAFGYAHYVLLLGIVCTAVGLKKAAAHAYDAIDTGPALALAGGVALFLVADVVFRMILRIDTGWARRVGAVAVPATIPLGTAVAAVAQVAALAAIVALATGAPLAALQRRRVRVETS
jgi:low temperature requirement protein LtrA